MRYAIGWAAGIVTAIIARLTWRIILGWALSRGD